MKGGEKSISLPQYWRDFWLVMEGALLDLRQGYWVADNVSV